MPKKAKKFVDEGLEDEIEKGKQDGGNVKKTKKEGKKDKSKKKSGRESDKKALETAAGGGAGGGSGIAATDASAAKKDNKLQKALEKREAGEKLSNKEKRLLKQYEEEKIREEEERQKAEDDLANFTLSLAGAGGEENQPGENVKDVKVENFSINADKKQLFVNATLSVVHGRRYGLVGPNGQGKSTLLRFMGARRFPIPAGIDVLYVEQEVVADETPAVDSVLRADTKRWSLMQEEVEITEKLEKDDQAGEEKEGAMDDQERTTLLERLTEIYDELSGMGADRAEAKARKILAGLGFNPEMQVRGKSRGRGRTET